MFSEEAAMDSIHFGMNLHMEHIYWLHWTIICRKAVPTGMIAGAMGQFLASPTDLVKVRLQMEGRRVLDGCKPRSGF